MKLTMMLLGGLLLSLSSAAMAIERSAALPYDYSNSINKVYVPSCTANQYVGVSAGKLVCRNIPTDCAAGQALSRAGGEFICTNVSAAPAPAPSNTQPKCTTNGSTLTMYGGTWYCVYSKSSGNSMGGCSVTCNGSDEGINCTTDAANGGGMSRRNNVSTCRGSVSMSSGEDHDCTAVITCRTPATY